MKSDNRKIRQTMRTKSAAGRPKKAGLYPDKPGFRPAKPVAVGGVLLADEPIVYNLGRQTVKLTVRNTGDRPIQVGSHFHLFEVNRYLEFDRDAAFGCHLNIPATTAIRFEPGDRKEVEAVAYSGKRRVIGFNGLVMGYTGDEDDPSYFPARLRAARCVREAGFKISGEREARHNAPAGDMHTGDPHTGDRPEEGAKPGSAPKAPARRKRNTKK